MLEQFIQRIHLRSLAELFAQLLSAEAEKQVLFSTRDLVGRLLRRWEEEEINSDAQENITLILAELLRKKDVLCCIEDLLQQLTSPNTVRFLVDHIFSTQGSAVPAATTLLSAVIAHTTAGRQDLSVCVSTPTLSPLSPPSPMILSDDEVVNIGADEHVLPEVVSRSVPPPNSPEPTLRGIDHPDEWLERRHVSLMREICSYFPRLRDLLDIALQQSDALNMPQGKICPVGSTTLEVVSLISTLTRTGSDVVFEEILNTGLLPCCVEVFFRHCWSSLLHNSVTLLLSEVLASSEGNRPKLVDQLLNEAHFASRLVQEYTADVEWSRLAPKQRHARVGYMGQLFTISTQLRDYGVRCSSQVREQLASTAGWTEVVLPTLEGIQRLHSLPLGGGIPESDRNLASSSTTDLLSEQPASLN